jgi:hypothetical protein
MPADLFELITSVQINLTNVTTQFILHSSPMSHLTSIPTTTDDNFSPANVTGKSAAVAVVLRLYFSELERVAFSLYIWISGLLSLGLNLLVLIVIGRERQLYTPENVIIAADAVNNIGLVLTAHPFVLTVLHLNVVKPNYYACQAFGLLATACFLFTSYLLVIYAYERYSFFCHPMSYGKRITKLRVAGAIFVTMTFDFMMNYVSALPSRVFTVTGLMCVTRDIFRGTAIAVTCFVLPAGATVVYAVSNIKRLQSR